MADLLPNVINQSFLTCQVCLEPYKLPKVLPCIHSFCQSCLLQCVEGRGGDRVSFPCPLCRSPTVLPKGGVQALKTNFFIASLQDVISSESHVDMPCDNCNDSTTAATRCLDCRDNLCAMCSEAHRRTKLTKAHKVFSIADIRTGKFEKELRECQPILCDIHHEPLKLYCSDCDQAICFNCKVTDHEGHRATNLRDVGKESKDILQHLLSKVHSRVVTMESFLKNLSQYDTSYEKQKEYMTSVIKDRCSSLHGWIEKYTSKLLQELNNVSKDEAAEISSYRDMILDHSKSLNEVAEFTSKILTHGTDGEILVQCKDLEQRLNKLQAIPCNDFIHKQKAELKLSQPELSSSDFGPLLGKLIKENASSVFSPHIVKGQCIKSFDCTSETDESVCYVCSIAMTADNNIAVLDQNNCKIKTFSGHTGHLVGEFRFGEKLKSPIALTILPDEKIAILDETRGIRVFSRSGRYVRQIYCPVKSPMGLGIDSNNHLLITDRRTKSVYITNMDGSHVDVISHERGQPMFQKPCGVISLPGNHYAVADIGNNSIKVINAEGRLKHEYGTKGDGKGQFNIPISLCNDHYGNIIVADYNNHRIHLLDREGTSVPFIVDKSEGLFRPTSVAVNNEGNLIVAKDSGNIRIYKYIN